MAQQGLHDRERASSPVSGFFPVIRVSVIIVNYGTADLVLQGVESVLARDHAGLEVDVHLLDNASPGDDADVFRRAAQQGHWQGRVTLYLEQTNHGFGRGNNLVFDALAAQETPPDFVFLLNPDARLRNDAITTLVSFVQDRPKVAIAGAKIIMPGIGTRVAAFRFPGILGEFGAATAFGPISRFFRRWEMPMAAELECQQVDWVAGASVMARFDVIRALDGFDPEYFLYYEEVDLMLRAARAGWQTWYVPQAEVDHDEGAATQVTGVAEERRRKPAYWYHSWGYYYRKNYGRLYALCAAVAWMKGAALNHVIAKVLGRPPAAPVGLFGDLWRTAVRPILGLKAK